MTEIGRKKKKKKLIRNDHMARREYPTSPQPCTISCLFKNFSTAEIAPTSQMPLSVHFLQLGAKSHSGLFMGAVW